jgi:hypothetical protein
MYVFTVPSADPPADANRTGDNPGAWWMGTVDVVARIMNGVDYRLFGLPFVQAANGPNNAVLLEIGGLTYIVNWSGMTLQDAIDFAVGMIQITMTVQRFTAGTNAQPGGIANVGGPIDVAVVRPGGRVQWIARKELHV